MASIAALGHTLRQVVDHPLNRSARFSAIGRYVGWQVRSRLRSGEHIVAFANGTRLYAASGEMGATGNIYSGLHEYEDMGFLLHFLRPGDVFYDVGANIGSYTVLASGAIGARTIAFEPVPDTAQRLARNVTLNGLEALVSVEAVGVGRNEGMMNFTSDRGSANRVLHAGDAPGIPSVEVPIRTLDSYAARAPATLIKMDAEGFEMEALAGSPATLANPELRAIIIELNECAAVFGARAETIAALIRGYGFAGNRYDPMTRKLTPLAEGADTGGAADGTDNVIFVRDRDWVCERLRAAPAFRVLGRSL